MKYISRDGVSDEQKTRAVKEIFSTVTGKYDFLNHFLSLRRDIFWRRFAVGKMRFFQTHRFLDVATGSGDLAIEASRLHPDIQVVGVDFVEEMLVLAGRKVQNETSASNVGLLKGNALDLPFPPDSFDVAGMAFGIRNIPAKARALKEMARVVVSGGQVLILEMVFPRHRYINSLYNIYLKNVLPLVARRLSSNPEAYQYLGESIMNFPSPARFLSVMKEAGLTRLESYLLTSGICHLFIGYKP